LPLVRTGSGSSLPVFSESIVLVFIMFLLDRVAVVTLIALAGRNIKAILQRLG
jgi:hypothetical protein